VAAPAHHIGWIDATDMIARGLCAVLASDYYYPAPLFAPFRLAAKGVLPLERAWALVAENPAQAIGLGDRGRVAEGRRADLILVDARDALHPLVVAAIVRGRIVYLNAPERLDAPRHAVTVPPARAPLHGG
jgi:alpha-D-ribose 1-methylphosphonate 5-triphosphate diphosphatase